MTSLFFKSDNVLPLSTRTPCAIVKLWIRMTNRFFYLWRSSWCLPCAVAPWSSATLGEAAVAAAPACRQLLQAAPGEETGGVGEDGGDGRGLRRALCHPRGSNPKGRPDTAKHRGEEESFRSCCLALFLSLYNWNLLAIRITYSGGDWSYWHASVGMQNFLLHANIWIFINSKLLACQMACKF